MIRNDMNFVRDTDPHYKYHTTSTYIQGFPYRYIIHDFQKNEAELWPVLLILLLEVVG